ncbi:MAG: ATP-binding protein, partial [Chloroflexota bacterium]
KAYAIQGVARDITAKRQAQEALRESERFAHSVVDALTANIAILDENGQIIAVNRGWQLFAAANGPFQRNVMEGANYLQVCDKVEGDDAADAHAFAEGIRAVLQGKQDEFSLEYACHSPSEKRWFVGRVTRFAGEGPVRVVIAHENTTERKKIENELIALYYATSFLFKSDSLSNLGYQVVQAVITAFDHVHCALLLKDKISGEIIRFTRSGVYEVTADNPLSVDGHGLVPQAFRTGKIIYSPNVVADALYLASDSRSQSELVIPLKTVTGILGVLDLQSITLDAFNQRDQRILTAFAERAAAAIENMQLYEEINRHAAELEWRVSKRTAELQRSKDRVEAILNHSSDVILLIDREGLIQQSNFTFYQEFGYQSGEEFGKRLDFLVDDNQSQSVLDALDKVLHDGQPQRLEIITHRRDGRSFDADMALSPIRVQEGENLGVICSLRDITTRKQLEADLHVALAVEKELNELKTRFVAMVSHDFRTPLSVILSSAEILEHYNERLDAAQKTHHFDKIGTQVSRMISLLNDVLTINRADANHLPFHPAPINLDQFCRDMAEEFQNTLQMKHTLAYSCSGGARIVVADEKLLQQAIINLLTNAFKYSPEGSTVEFNLSFDRDNAVIRIKDKGIGIPEADQPHLFEAFHRAGNVGDVEGTGLGLAIVKRSIEAHRGKITVESQVGAGTTFVVYLPYLEPEKIAL